MLKAIVIPFIILLINCGIGLEPARVLLSVEVSANITMGEPPIIVQFHSIVQSSNRECCSYFWSFGNGDTSTEENPTYQFTSVGIYTVILTVIDEFGTTVSDDLVINAVPSHPWNQSPVDTTDVALVWAGHPVGFALLTSGSVQYVCYFDPERLMTISSRNIDEKNWVSQPLPSITDWDIHKYITMAIDSEGFLHVSGNMHVDQLLYFRMTEKNDITSMCQEPMTGEFEENVTYPRFLYNNEGDLLFLYRDGSSGDGRRLINIYDTDTKTWSKYINIPLLDGTQRDMNAYPGNIIKGPDNWYHLFWVWRDTPVASTCHDLSYAKSPNVKEWYTAGREVLDLPITPDQPEAIVDPVPSIWRPNKHGDHALF